MTMTNSWELPLISLAHEATNIATHSERPSFQDVMGLNQASEYCTKMTAVHSRSFYLASALLPVEKRAAVRALYAFCRVTDDIVDNPLPSDGTPATADQIRHRLQIWKQRVFSSLPPTNDPVALAWVETQSRFQIPPRLVEQLIDGVLADLDKTRYATFDELAAYSYGVASTVGLMSMHIIGFNGPEAISYAVKLGIALQLTNILRDVGEDWRKGRLYLPLEELAAFDLGEADIAAGRVDDRWRAFMRFQIARNRRLYAEAWPGIATLSPDGRTAIAAAADLYAGILTDIEKHDFDVFRRRAHLNGRQKLGRLPRIWWRSRASQLRRMAADPAAITF